MRYSDNIDYLLASIIYLGTHTYWWARSPRNMAKELHLEEGRLQEVFDGFPGIFRKSDRVDKKTHQHFYSLQARYAQREGGDEKDPDQASYIEALDVHKLQLIMNFILKMAEEEHKLEDQALKRAEQQQSRAMSLRNNLIAVVAAILSATAAIVAAWVHR
jgi:hypothetical protein